MALVHPVQCQEITFPIRAQERIWMVITTEEGKSPISLSFNSHLTMRLPVANRHYSTCSSNRTTSYTPLIEAWLPKLDRCKSLAQTSTASWRQIAPRGILSIRAQQSPQLRPQAQSICIILVLPNSWIT